MAEDRNVLGEELETCSIRPMTGFYRTGCCETGPEDVAAHVVCAELTEEFLAFSTHAVTTSARPCPRSAFGIESGRSLAPVCRALKEALDAGAAPRVVLRATHRDGLEYVSLEELRRHALDLIDQVTTKRWL